MLKRDQVPKAALPEEEVLVPSLGDTVMVRGLPLSFVLNYYVISPEFSFEQSVFKILSQCVVLEDGAPLYTEEEWDIFSSGRKDDIMLLLEAVKRLSGINQETVEKNSNGQP